MDNIDETQPDDSLFYANGINGATGGYGLTPMSESELADIITGEEELGYLPDLKEKVLEIERRNLPELEKQKAQLEAEFDASSDSEQRKHLEKAIKQLERKIDQLSTLGVIEGINPNDLAEAGWGVIFADNDEQTAAIKEAMSELLTHRKHQTGPLFKLFEGPDGYRAGETYFDFLSRFGVGPGPVDPKKGVPYYLLIIGSPEAIPYAFQYQLDVQYAVGRIYFDAIDDYAQYARSVVAAETGQVKLARRASFFGVENPNDRATQLSTKHLIKPLHETFSANHQSWQLDLLIGDKAKKSTLEQSLNGEECPAILFTASHGMEFPQADSRQLPHQGALLCQDWPGPRRWRKEIPQDFYFAGDDLDRQTNLTGLISFHFACYGAGTPQYDEFSDLKQSRRAIAERPFMAELPKQLLRRGALASIGHVERAWGHSFFWESAGPQLAVFESALESLFKGKTIGYGLEYFNERYAELSVALTPLLEKISWGQSYDERSLVTMWTANKDARNYIVIGDPAARLPIAETDEAVTTRPTFTITGQPKPAAHTTTQPAQAAALPKPHDSIQDNDWTNTPEPIRMMLIQAFAVIGEVAPKRLDEVVSDKL